MLNFNSYKHVHNQDKTDLFPSLEIKCSKPVCHIPYQNLQPSMPPKCILSKKGFSPSHLMSFAASSMGEDLFKMIFKGIWYIWAAATDTEQMAPCSIFPWYLLGIPACLHISIKLKGGSGTTCSLCTGPPKALANSPLELAGPAGLLIPFLTRLPFRPSCRLEALVS